MGQKLGDDVGPGTHQKTNLLVKLELLESLIFLSSHLCMEHFTITLAVTSFPAGLKHPLHIQEQGPSISARPQCHKYSQQDRQSRFLGSEVGSNTSSPGKTPNPF